MWAPAYILYGYDNTMSASGHTLQVGVTMLLLLMMMMTTNDDAVLISCTAAMPVVTTGTQYP